mmetsp:Transcript_7747/g.31491  ORF Transcript_7747/g.31491 Transcript_7747/m.31491 type:complete len:210 (-) Transcript_7747:1445-2074(-)
MLGRSRANGFGAPHRPADDDHDRHPRRRGHCGAGQAHCRRRRHARAHHRAGHAGGQGVQGDPRAPLGGRLRHPAVRRHPLRAQGGAARGRVVGEDPRQPWQLRRRPQDVRGEELRLARGLPGGAGLHRGDLHAARAQVQGAEPHDPYRHQPRLPVGAHAVVLRRHPRGHGGVGVRVRAHLPQARLPQLCLLHEGVQPACDGAGLPPAGR